MKFFSDKEARAAAARLTGSRGVEYHVYRCQFCRARHLTSKTFTPEQRTQLRTQSKAQARTH